MFCSGCGTQLKGDSVSCSHCGAKVVSCEERGEKNISPKSRLALVLLSALPFAFALFGVHRLYAGKTASGVVMLGMGIVATVWMIAGSVGATLSGSRYYGQGMALAVAPILAMCVWALIDFIIAVTGNFKDSQGRVIRKW